MKNAVAFINTVTDLLNKFNTLKKWLPLKFTLNVSSNIVIWDYYINMINKTPHYHPQQTITIIS